MDWKYPLIKPNPAKLSECAEELRVIEASGKFSNYGPTNTNFENRVIDELFASRGHAVTVCNATIGLMVALKYAVDCASERPATRGKYVIVPSFTFAATVHAIDWCGLTPLFCDIDQHSWQLDVAQVRKAVQQYKGDIAAIMTYPTFGCPLDLDPYEELNRKFGIPVVIDAAASLGSLNTDGLQFGIGSCLPIVYSLHVTKVFSTSEGGLIYSTDEEAIQTMRQMGNFGFDAHKEVQLPGLNSKLSEVSAVLCLKKLDDISGILSAKRDLVSQYKQALSSVSFQDASAGTPSHAIFPIRIHQEAGKRNRDEVAAALETRGIQTAKYFSPPLHQNAYFQKFPRLDDLKNTDMLAQEILHLPIYDDMSSADVEYIANAVNELTETSFQQVAANG
jgi:dTDP-4-amino-4,6-dideoxygalactose transaminase